MFSKPHCFGKYLSEYPFCLLYCQFRDACERSRDESFTERKVHEMKVCKHPNTTTKEKEPSQEGE